MNFVVALVVGLSAGALYAVIGVGLTLMSVLTRVINFSIVAVGVFGAFLSIRARAAAGAGTARGANRGRGGHRRARGGHHLGAAGLDRSDLARRGIHHGALGRHGRVAAHADLAVVRPLRIAPAAPSSRYSVGPAFVAGDIAVTKVGVALLITAVAVAVAAWIVIRRTPLGVRLRAISDRQTAAELLGVNVKALQIGVWVVVGGIMGALHLASSAIPGAADATSMINSRSFPARRPPWSAHSRVSPMAIVGGLLVGGIARCR